MDRYWVTLEFAFCYFWIILSDAPGEYSSLFMVTNHTVPNINGAQLTQYSNSVFDIVALDFRIYNIQFPLFINADGGYHDPTRLH